jgi:hypothetical protein
VATGLVAWLAMVGVDLALHAGLLAPFYDWDSPFLLDPVDAFVRIPAGYAAFLLIAAGVAWLLPRLGVTDARGGALCGGAIGAVGWGALLLATWSISSANATLLLAWWVGQTVQLAVGGAVVGAAIAGRSMRGLTLTAGAVLVIGAVLAVVLQSIGYAPAPVVIGG